MLDYRTFFSEDDDDQTQRHYWGNEGAGCIFIAKDTGRILIAHRSNQVHFEPNTWGTWGGKVDGDETPKQAVEREVEEETGFSGKYTINHLYTYQDGKFKYHNFLILVPFEFTPTLNWENDDSKWVEFGHWPKPLHFGMAALLTHPGDKIKKVVDLVKKKKDNLQENVESVKHKKARRSKVKKALQENMNGFTIKPMGLVDEGIFGYELRSPYSFIRYGYEPATSTFYLYNIMTPNVNDTNQGHATTLLDYFFQVVKQSGGALDIGPYTGSGDAYIKHVVERFSKKYSIPLVKGRKMYD